MGALLAPRMVFNEQCSYYFILLQDTWRNCECNLPPKTVIAMTYRSAGGLSLRKRLENNVSKHIVKAHSFFNGGVSSRSVRMNSVNC